jgi:hypothetical protein
MDAGAVVFARLANSTSAGSRIYPLLLPQQPTLPAVTYQQVSAVRTHAMGQDVPVVRVRAQVNAWGKTYAEARTLANETLTRLARFKGVVGAVQVLDVLADNEMESYESDTQTRRVILDFSLFLRNSTNTP